MTRCHECWNFTQFCTCNNVELAMGEDGSMSVRVVINGQEWLTSDHPKAQEMMDRELEQMVKPSIYTTIVDNNSSELTLEMLNRSWKRMNGDETTNL